MTQSNPSVEHSHDPKNPISNETGEYLQSYVEDRETNRTKKSGVQVNIDETNAANEKLEGDSLPNTFDKTEEGQRAHEAKFGIQREESREGEAVNTEDTTALNPERQLRAKNQKR